MTNRGLEMALYLLFHWVNPMFGKLFNSAASSILSSLTAKGANPLAVEWVLHYIKGSKTDKVLPPKAIQELKPRLANVLNEHINGVWEYATPVAEPGWSMGIEDQKIGGVTHSSDWFTSLWGVVGKYQFSIKEINQEGILLKCWDLFDFNLGTREKLTLPIPGEYVNIATRILNTWEVRFTLADGKIILEEANLSALNKDKAFYTKWECFIEWDLIMIHEVVKQGILSGDTNNPFHLIYTDSYILPRWREKERALRNRGIDIYLDPLYSDEWYKLDEHWRNV